MSRVTDSDRVLEALEERIRVLWQVMLSARFVVANDLNALNRSRAQMHANVVARDIQALCRIRRAGRVRVLGLANLPDDAYWSLPEVEDTEGVAV
jgi:hypothetical protein